VWEGLGQQNILYIPLTILQYTTTTSAFTSPDVKTDPSRSIVSMNQQSVVMYLSVKGLNGVEIHNDFVATLKGEAKFYSTVTYYLRKPSFSSPKTPHPLRVQLQFLMNWMKQSCWLYLKSFSRQCGSLRAEPAYTLPPSTIASRTSWVHRLISSLGATSSVGANKHTRAQLSFELFEMLQHEKDRAWHDIVTFDESWFISRQIASGSGFLRELKPWRGSGSPFSRER
jgi:hypothetical protein